MLEILVLVKAGQMMGAWNTIGVLIISGILGLWLLKREGRRVMQTVLMEIRKGVLPSLQITQGLVLAISAILLIIPGFISDAFGLLLLVPQVRVEMARWLETQLVQRSIFGGVQVNVGHFGDDHEVWPPRADERKTQKDVTPAQVIDFAQARNRLTKPKDDLEATDLDSI